MSALRADRDGPVLRVTLARPERRNAFDAGLIGELTGAFADVGDARAVVLTGEGPSFSAGADVEWMRASADLTHDENVADALRLRAMLEAIDGCPAPVVAGVHGHALGGGCGLVACSDIVVAERRTQFGFSEVKLGIVPAVISPFALRKIGSSAARRYFVTGERFSADTALALGLVHEVTDDVPDALERIVRELLTAGPHAARAAKELARSPRTAQETAQEIAAHRAGAEGQEGLHAFLEKRRPTWAVD
jgi:methylglutaconyl-CoA hydratase